MADVVVTVPKRLWSDWIAEGDLPGEPHTARLYIWRMASVKRLPARLMPGDRVYVVAHGKLRGYAPLVRMAIGSPAAEMGWGSLANEIGLIRGGGAVAVTIAQVCPSFQGFRYRWWERDIEVPFPDWRTP